MSQEDTEPHRDQRFEPVHGGVYDYLNNRKAQCRGAALGSTGRDRRYDQNRYGRKAGGPVIKNSVFALRISNTSPAVSTTCWWARARANRRGISPGPQTLTGYPPRICRAEKTAFRFRPQRLRQLWSTCDHPSRFCKHQFQGKPGSIQRACQFRLEHAATFRTWCADTCTMTRARIRSFRPSCVAVPATDGLCWAL